jgi:hypothetical protein
MRKYKGLRRLCFRSRRRSSNPLTGPRQPRLPAPRHEHAFVTHLHLRPRARAPAAIRRARVPWRPCPRTRASSTIAHAFAPSSGRPATRQHHGVAVELVFEKHAALRERPRAEIAASDLEGVEADEDRWGAQETAVGVAEQMEAAHELFVEDGDLRRRSPGPRRAASRSRRRARGSAPCGRRRCGRSGGRGGRPCKRASSSVRPDKVDVFSGRQTRRGKSQTPRSLDGRTEGNRSPEAHRRSHRQDGERVTGP